MARRIGDIRERSRLFDVGTLGNIQVRLEPEEERQRCEPENTYAAPRSPVSLLWRHNPGPAAGVCAQREESEHGICHPDGPQAWGGLSLPLLRAASRV